MAEATLVELIEAYERARIDFEAWKATKQSWDFGNEVRDALFRAELAIEDRLLRIKRPAVAYQGMVYTVVEGWGFEVFRDVPSADEIDGEAKDA